MFHQYAYCVAFNQSLAKAMAFLSQTSATTEHDDHHDDDHNDDDHHDDDHHDDLLS